jgi:ribosomal protein S27AE
MDRIGISFVYFLLDSQVNEDGKITRLRKECRDKSCPAATFMGVHYDRYSCGRCGLTLVYSGDE